MPSAATAGARQHRIGALDGFDRQDKALAAQTHPCPTSTDPSARRPPCRGRCRLIACSSGAGWSPRPPRRALRPGSHAHPAPETPASQQADDRGQQPRRPRTRAPDAASTRTARRRDADAAETPPHGAHQYQVTTIMLVQQRAHGLHRPQPDDRVRKWRQNRGIGMPIQAQHENRPTDRPGRRGDFARQLAAAGDDAERSRRAFRVTHPGGAHVKRETTQSYYLNPAMRASLERFFPVAGRFGARHTRKIVSR